MYDDGSDALLGSPEALVIGAGPAGLTAAMFLARYGRDVIVVDELMENHMINAATVENFPGFPEGIEGPELWALLQQQAAAAGAQFVPATAHGIDLEAGEGGRSFRVGTTAGTHRAAAVVVCVGSSLRRLGVSGEAEFQGKGISHCATCDGPLFQDRSVAVIGGGDSALDTALKLSEFASQVTVIHRGDVLDGQKTLLDRVAATANVAVRARTEVVRFEGDRQLQALVLRSATSSAEVPLEVAGAFTLVGLEPNTKFLEGLVELDAAGHVVADPLMQTSTPGLFVAGDIRQHSAAQFVSAAGDGATAALAAHRFIETDRPSPPATLTTGGGPEEMEVWRDA